MMSSRINRFGYLLIIFPLLLVVTSSSGINFSSGIDTVDSTILVNSNAELLALGFPGDGSVGNPITITGIFSSSSGNAIDITNTDLHILITSISINGSSNEDGIYLKSTQNIVIEKSIITNNDNGIYIYKSSNITISNNTIENSKTGINNRDVSDLIIQNNTINHSQGGINIDSRFSSAGSHVLVSNNLITGSTNYGITITGGANNIIEYNTLQNNSNGLYLGGTTKTTIQYNFIQNNTNGIYVNTGAEYGRQTSLIIENNISQNNVGILAYYSNMVNITNNHINLNFDGIVFSGNSGYMSSKTNVSDNSIKANLNYGVLIKYGTQISLINNSISENSLLNINISSTSGGNQIIFNSFDNSSKILNNGFNTYLELNYYGSLNLTRDTGKAYYDDALVTSNFTDNYPLIKRYNSSLSVLTTPILSLWESVVNKIMYTNAIFSYNTSGAAVSHLLQLSTDNVTWIDIAPVSTYFVIDTTEYDDGDLYLRFTVNSGSEQRTSIVKLKIANRQVHSGSFTSPKRLSSTLHYYDTLNISWKAGYVSGTPALSVRYNLYYAEYSPVEKNWTLIVGNMSGLNYNWNITDIKRTSYLLILETKSDIGSVNVTSDAFWIDDTPTFTSNTNSDKITDTTSKPVTTSGSDISDITETPISIVFFIPLIIVVYIRRKLV